MSIKKEFYGVNCDENVYMYTIENKNRCSMSVINYGCIIVSFKVPDKDGKYDDIVLGLDKLDDYVNNNYAYFGVTVGRYANRINNSHFVLDGKSYQLDKNEGENHIHGGHKGIGKVMWNAEILKDDISEYLKLTYLSIDGECGYPGNVKITNIYRLTDENELIIDYIANSDKDTILNLTNHTYFNLKGHKNGNVLDHYIKINSDFYTKSDEKTMPTGEVLKVENTPFDFRKEKLLDNSMKKDKDFKNYIGFDQNFIINNYSNEELKFAASVSEKTSGRCMKVYTTKPGIQFYTGNFLDKNVISKDKSNYDIHSGLCLETQYFPDSINFSHFSSPILKKGDDYKHKTIYKII
ncbi:MAG: aldose epimerase family protein [Clostridiales bacterium]